MPEEPDADRPLPAAAAAALSLGRIADAIRQVREAEHIGLRDASRRLADHIQRHPGLRSQFEERQRRIRRRVILWVVVADAVVIAAVSWWLFGR